MNRIFLFLVFVVMTSLLIGCGTVQSARLSPPPPPPPLPAERTWVSGYLQWQPYPDSGWVWVGGHWQTEPESAPVAPRSLTY